MRRLSIALLILAACDDASFIVRVHREQTSDVVGVQACGSCAVATPFSAAPDALDRSIGFFVHTVPETLTLRWTVDQRCDQLGVRYSGSAFSFDLNVSGQAAPVVSGCPSCTDPSPCEDNSGGGAGGGSAAGGGSTGGGSAAGGGAMGGGSAAGGGSTGGGGGGSVDGGPLGPLHWSSMTLPSGIHGVVAVQAFSADEVWAAATESNGNAVLYLSDAGTWTPALETSSSDGFTDLAIISSPKRIAAVELGKVYECDRSTVSCRSASDWQMVPIDDFSHNNLNKLCTDGVRFYATGDTPGAGALFINNGSVYQLTATAPSVGRLNGCTVIADGSVLSVGFGNLAWYVPGSGITVIEIDTTGFLGRSVVWDAAHTAGGRTFFGGDDRTLVELLPDAGFSLGLNPGPSARLRAMAGVNPNDLIAAGDDISPYGTVLFDGTTWSSGPSLFPKLNVFGMSALDDRTYFAGGQLLNGSGGVIGGMILRGTR